MYLITVCVKGNEDFLAGFSDIDSALRLWQRLRKPMPDDPPIPGTGYSRNVVSLAKLGEEVVMVMQRVGIRQGKAFHRSALRAKGTVGGFAEGEQYFRARHEYIKAVERYHEPGVRTKSRGKENKQ